jgi:hypothetical protein
VSAERGQFIHELGEYYGVAVHQELALPHAVRLVRRSDSYNFETDGFDDFLDLAEQLAD